MQDKLDNLYRDIIMDHYRYPRGKKGIEHPDLVNLGHNPSCGDEIKVALKIDHGRVENISVDCMGCAISVASGSMLAEVIKGKTIEEVKKAVRSILRGEKPPENIDLGDLEALRGVRKFPVRIKCALLSWTTVADAIEGHTKGETVSPSTTEGSS
jgi:nitrogen fixation NifU-like protein